MTHADIKREVLVLAGMLAPFETMTTEDAATPLPKLVARVLSNPYTGHVQATVIALALADALTDSRGD